MNDCFATSAKKKNEKRLRLQIKLAEYERLRESAEAADRVGISVMRDLDRTKKEISQLVRS